DGGQADRRTAEGRRLGRSYGQPGQVLVSGGKRVADADRGEAVVPGGHVVGEARDCALSLAGEHVPGFFEGMAVGGDGAAGAQLVQPDLQVTGPAGRVDEGGVPQPWDGGGFGPLPPVG